MAKLTQFDRHEIVISHQQGKSQRAIARLTGFSRFGVQALLKKFEEFGEVKDRKRSGRPKKLNALDKKYLKVTSLRDRRKSSKVLAHEQGPSSTTTQISLLSKAKKWYIDGTFKLCRHPFKQLFTINAFVRDGENVKQLPLCFVFMSGQSSSGYQKILQELLHTMPNWPIVLHITLYFETAIWKAWRAILPGVQLSGCVFHWTQALWRKVQGLGLQSAYSNDQAISSYIRWLMALPYLPQETIPQMFKRLKVEATTVPLQSFMHYTADTWIYSSVWLPKNWSIFMQTTRTNNNVESWHHRLNQKCVGRCGIQFYMLIDLLHKEASLEELNIQLVSEGKVRRIQRKKYRQLQGQVAFSHFYSPAAAGDKCTLYSNRNLINCRSVRSDVNSAVNPCRRFFVLEIEAHIVAAGMKELHIEELEEQSLFVADQIDRWTNGRKNS
ncbi:uncharacterized protein LOC114541028 [Dendronephthya gigantea]|uniref:uncharacterized protein LOC114541028 n=1 Tax=Dendronephthya gigantea TaxID=151771 RepID=UPI00106D8F12|nr:uncharacterized protein LOC114541028 [Dendronephthya gigantea]